jgi:hypothetical protein
MKEKGLMIGVLGLVFLYLIVGLVNFDKVNEVEPCYSISP